MRFILNMTPARRLLTSLNINWRQFTAGFLFLAAGSHEYLFSRPLDSAYFLQPISPAIADLNGIIELFGTLGNQAPDFFHPLGFALMSMALLPSTFLCRLTMSLSWFCVDAAFELFQKYGHAFVDSLPQWLSGFRLIDCLSNTHSYGTFDYLDLWAIGAGALAALAIGHLIKGDDTYVEKT